MLHRNLLLGLTVAGLSFTLPTRHCMAETPVVQLISMDDKPEAGKKDDEHDEEEHKKKKIEQDVPMNMVPQTVLDAVKKEVPGGTITEAELEVKKDKIMYGFDVKLGDMTYNVNITVDGKFFSKKVDDEKDEKDEKKPAAVEKN